MPVVAMPPPLNAGKLPDVFPASPGAASPSRSPCLRFMPRADKLDEDRLAGERAAPLVLMPWIEISVHSVENRWKTN
jgi:hypothetical protein